MNETMPRRLSRHTIYESDYVSFYYDRVLMPDGSIIEKYHQVHMPSESAALVIEDAAGRILMELSKRYTTNSLEWELPAGRIEPEETPAEAAAREAREETGCRVKELQSLGSFYPANSMCDLKVNFFRALLAEQSGDADPNEVAGCRWFSPEEVLALVREDKLHCGTTLAGLMAYFAHKMQ